MVTCNDEDTSNRVDYDEEGRKLLARVHLLDNDDNDDKGSSQDDDAAMSAFRRAHAYSNPIYRDPTTGGTVHVGNHMAAESLGKLNDMTPAPCRRIVYCLDRQNGKPFQDNPEFTYHDFNIGWWRQTLGHDRYDPIKVLEFFQPFFDFLDAELKEGRAILIHCLAGAHRAGTAGIASLMYLTGMSAEEATKAAKSLRPIINPISDFPKLLQTLEAGLKLKQEQEQAQGAGAGLA
ncbi:unnamed protein product [Cylindrotheca closterium]|uniref:protein-tyrosine-phosphatase n=1 Tax=Cylindrotheca closterium TaxID=2856 RepID=A0AAD2FQA6_9STRA|nr:unnamed protein product [Cylindrotheca closterium]